MGEKKESTIILRVSDDTRAYLEKTAQKQGVKLSACVREIIENKKSGNFVIQNNSVAQNEVQSYLDDIRSMVGDLKKFLIDLDNKLTWGELELQDGLIVPPKAEVSDDLKNLQDACDEKGIDINEAIRKTAQSIWSIRQ